MTEPREGVGSKSKRFPHLVTAAGVLGLVLCVAVVVWQLRFTDENEYFRQRVDQANALGERGDYKSAVRVLEEIVHQRPKTKSAAEALLRIGGMWEAAHDDQKAEAAYKRLLTEAPDAHWRRMAKISLSSIQRLRSKRLRRKLPLSRDPIAAEFSSATLLQRHGAYIPAAQRYEDIARISPKHELAPFALLEAGDCYFLAGRPIDAQTRWREVIRRYPDSSWKCDAEFALDAINNPGLRESMRRVLLGGMP